MSSKEGQNRSTMDQVTFYINPVAAPRMTQSDKWKTKDNPDPKRRQRKCVTKYFAYRDYLRLTSIAEKFKLPGELNITFYIEMPKSWSNKKRNQMNGEPHRIRPDLDNYCKGVCDSLAGEDGFVWRINASKYWSETGKIVIQR